MTKLAVTDVDGTLVKESTLNINSEYYDVIRALHAKGIRVVLAGYYIVLRKLNVMRINILFQGGKVSFICLLQVSGGWTA